MSNEPIQHELSELLGPGFNEEAPAEGINEQFSTEYTEDSHRKFVTAYSKMYNKLPDDKKVFAFRNVIRGKKGGGYLGHGLQLYLVNTDIENTYRVTVRYHWQEGINSGQMNKVYTMNPGGFKGITSSDSGSLPLKDHRCEVVEEVIVG